MTDSLSQHCPNCEAQAAEIERLGSVIDATALHWLALQDKHHVPWEGAIDGAMAAACAEIEKLREALEAVWKEATTMRNASKLVGPYPTQPEKNRLWARSMYHAGKRIMEMLKPIRAALGETK